MLNPWMAFSIQAARLGWDAQNAIALRWLRLVGGDARARSEDNLIVAEKADTLAPEKVDTLAHAQHAPTIGAVKGASGSKVATSIVKVYKKKKQLRGKKRRLSK